jgi:hypothetical protein
MPQSIGDDLRRLGAKAGRNRIAVTVIGNRMRDAETGRVVPMETSCASFTVCTRGAGYADPSPEDRKAIHKFWKKNPLAPDYYEYMEGQRPPLKIKPKTKTEYRPSHTEADNEEI